MGNFTGFEKSEDYYQHPKLGLIKRIQTEGGPQLIEHKVAVESEEVFEQWKQCLRSFEHSNLAEVLFIPHNYYFQRVGYCGWNGEVFLLYDDFMFSLKDEIENRFKIKRPYPESTVIEMLYQLIKAERDLEKLNFRIRHINSDSIMVNEDGDWRIISEHSYPQSYFTPIKESKEVFYFLSPEECQEQSVGGLARSKSLKSMKETNRKERKTEINENVAETFSIGMLLLEICTLEKSSLIYKNGFNIGLLHERIKIAQTRYSFAFLNILKGMLELVPNQRMKCEEIVKILQPHEKLILTHKQISLQFNPMAEANKNAKNEVNGSIRISSNVNNNQNRWERLTNFFPFLHQETKSNEEMKTLQRSNSCSGERRNVSVARAE